MKFFYCPSCKAEYSFLETEVEKAKKAGEQLYCRDENVVLIELTAKDLEDRQATRFKDAAEAAKVVAGVKLAAKIKFLNEGGVPFIEVDGKKLRVTGYLRVMTEAGEVQISL